MTSEVVPVALNLGSFTKFSTAAMLASFRTGCANCLWTKAAMACRSCAPSYSIAFLDFRSGVHKTMAGRCCAAVSCLPRISPRRARSASASTRPRSTCFDKKDDLRRNVVFRVWPQDLPQRERGRYCCSYSDKTAYFWNVPRPR